MAFAYFIESQVHGQQQLYIYPQVLLLVDSSSKLIKSGADPGRMSEPDTGQYRLLNSTKSLKSRS